MPATRSNAALLSAVTTSGTGSPVDVSAGYGGTVGVSISQPATASTPASFALNWSPDGGTTYYALPTIQGPTAAAPAPGQAYSLDIPIGATKLTMTFTASAGTTATCTAQVSWVTGL